MAALQLVLVCAVLGVVLCAEDAKWTYTRGPDGRLAPVDWKKSYSKCGDKVQSPIDLIPKKAHYDANLTKITLEGFDKDISLKMKNNGHTIVLSTDATVRANGGDLPGKMKLAQLHFHWGQKTGQGSEHTADGKASEAEVHFVMYNADKYSDLNDALKDEHEGVAVLGICLKQSATSNAAMKQITANLSGVATPMGAGTDLTARLDALVPKDQAKYYRYQGSLTTPPCDEVITWTVYKEVVTISETEMKALRDNLFLNEEKNITLGDNYRPVQPLGDRKVYISWKSGGGDTSGATALGLSGVLLAACLFLFR